MHGTYLTCAVPPNAGTAEMRQLLFIFFLKTALQPHCISGHYMREYCNMTIGWPRGGGSNVWVPTSWPKIGTTPVSLKRNTPWSYMMNVCECAAAAAALLPTVRCCSAVQTLHPAVQRAARGCSH